MSHQSAPLNILLLGGAKRLSIAGKIAVTGYRYGLDVNLFSVELEHCVPIAAIAKTIIGPRWSDPDILSFMHKTVTENNIDIILPFVDGAVEVAARYVALHPEAGVYAPVGSPEGAAAMFDKVEAARRFAEAGIPIPLTIDPADPQFPLIAKPRRGSASKGIRIVRNADELQPLLHAADHYLFQQYIADATEVTVDCFRTVKGGDVICTVPRLRLEVTGGEVMRTRTIRHPLIEAIAAETLRKLDLRGTVTMQFLLPQADGSQPLMMEINPRLGGGVVCSVHAGANFPEFLILDATGVLDTPCTDWREGVEIARFMQEVAFENGTVISR